MQCKPLPSDHISKCLSGVSKELDAMLASQKHLGSSTGSVEGCKALLCNSGPIKWLKGLYKGFQQIKGACCYLRTCNQLRESSRHEGGVFNIFPRLKWQYKSQSKP